MVRLWQKGLWVASKWAYKVAREGLTVPIPQAVFERLVRRLARDAAQELKVRPRAPAHLVITGRKKVGIWLDVTAVFRLEPPAPDGPPRSLRLIPECVRPLPARSPVLSAMAAVPGVEREEGQLRIDLDRLMADDEWGRRLPAAVRQRLRVAEVAADSRRIQLRLRLCRHTAA